MHTSQIIQINHLLKIIELKITDGDLEQVGVVIFLLGCGNHMAEITVYTIT